MNNTFEVTNNVVSGSSATNDWKFTMEIDEKLLTMECLLSMFSITFFFIINHIFALVKKMF